jgi:4-amino-4-deoxy-L-arabinose transferase-like glycosyltransferase
MTSKNETPKPESAGITSKPNRTPFWLGMLALLFSVAFVLPGLTGHGPWQQDEVESLDIVHGMLETGDLLVPKLGNEPYIERPPAFYVTAATIAELYNKALSLPLPQGTQLPDALKLSSDDAARLATALYLFILFGFTVLLGRATWVRDDQNQAEGAIALLVLMGTLGLVQSAHLLVAEIAVSAGIAMALYGLVIAPRRVFWGGLWLGTGAGLAFMSEGLVWLGIIGITALLLPLFRDWRSGRYLRALMVALLAALPWLLVWPALLYLRDPDLFQTWLWGNNIQRYLEVYQNSAQLVSPATTQFWLHTWPWFTFPAAVLALLALLLRVVDFWSSRGVRVLLVASIVGWALLLLAPNARELYALPLLAPLAVLAAGGVTQLPRWVITPVYLLSLLIFGLGAVLLWGLWTYHMFTGQPLQHGALAAYLPMDFDFVWRPVAFVTAAFFTFVWVWILMQFRAPRRASLLVWPAGIVMLWGLVSLLHLPWVDAASTLSGKPSETRAAMPVPASAAGVADAEAGADGG